MNAESPLITVFRIAKLKKKRLTIDGRTCNVKLGAWAYYVPDLQLKLFHTSEGLLHCRHATAPDRDALMEGSAQLHNDTYTIKDWQNAYSKHVIRRAAETFVVADLLYQAGLGPKPFGLCLVMEYRSDASRTSCVNSGLFIENLHNYPAKKPATEDCMLRAGVIPDRIRSCIRQQINGYVSDLNSVVGVTAKNSEYEIKRLERILLDRCKPLLRAKVKSSIGIKSIFKRFVS